MNLLNYLLKCDSTNRTSQWLYVRIYYSVEIFRFTGIHRTEGARDNEEQFSLFFFLLSSVQWANVNALSLTHCRTTLINLVLKRESKSKSNKDHLLAPVSPSNSLALQLLSSIVPTMFITLRASNTVLKYFRAFNKLSPNTHTK